jgi:hypothetical protein
MTYCGIRLIRGYNGAMVFWSSDSLLRTGFTNDFFDGGPNQLKTKDSRGYDVLQPMQPYTGGANDALVKYYRTVVPEGEDYILPDDHASSHGTNDKKDQFRHLLRVT